MPSTLLLADDSVTIQRVIELTFADEDIRVVAVSDGDQAIAALGNNPPDIVLADVGMPGRDGYQVAEHIKHTPALSHIPVLLLTGAFEPVDQARAARVGCDGVLAKPFEPQLVIGRVKELLAKPKPALTALDAPSPAPAPAAPASAALDESAAPAPVSPSADPEEVDRYFDRLDRAFASLSSGNVDGPSPSKPPAAEIDWFSTTAPSQPAAAHPAVGDGRDEARSTHSEASAAPLLPPPGEAPPPPPPPQLADAFAALLAAEQAVPAAPVAWGPLGAPAAHPEPQELKISDEVIEEIVRRVLARMSDQVVRETVANLASETAERLVKDEIERIKNR